jgi:hypothetical protein
MNVPGSITHLLSNPLRRRFRKAESRFERVGASIGIGGAELRRIFLDEGWCVSMNSVTFCRLIREGRLVLREGRIVAGDEGR